MLHIVKSQSSLNFKKKDEKIFWDILDRFNKSALGSDPDLSAIYKHLREDFSKNGFFCHIGGHHVHVEKTSGFMFTKKIGKAFFIDLSDIDLADTNLEYEDRLARIEFAIKRDIENLILTVTKNFNHTYPSYIVEMMRNSKHDSVLNLARELTAIQIASIPINTARIPSKPRL